jgi:hypothetical protein
MPEDDPRVLTAADVAAAKADAGAPGAPTDAPLIWRAHLWANVSTAIEYANSSPLSPPGTIIFNIRDNGQVWTYDLH